VPSSQNKLIVDKLSTRYHRIITELSAQLLFVKCFDTMPSHHRNFSIDRKFIDSFQKRGECIFPLSTIQLFSKDKNTMSAYTSMQASVLAGVSLTDIYFHQSILTKISQDEGCPQFYISLFHCNTGINKKRQQQTCASARLNPKSSEELACNLLIAEFNDAAKSDIQAVCDSSCFVMSLIGLTLSKEPKCIAACLYDVYASGVYIHYIACCSVNIDETNWGSIINKLVYKHFSGHQLSPNLLSQVQRCSLRLGSERKKMYLQVRNDTRKLPEMFYHRLGFTVENIVTGLRKFATKLTSLNQQLRVIIFA